MDYFLLLLIVYTMLFITSITVFNLKIMSPSIIFTASFTLMVYLAFATKEAMGFTVSKSTFEIFAIGGFLFVITEFLVMLFHSIRKNSIVRAIDHKPLYIKQTTLNLFFLIMCFSFVLALVSIMLSTSGSIGNRMEVYKNMMLNDIGNVRFRFLLNQLYKINTATSYVCAYIVVYNWSVCRKKLRANLKCLLIIGLFIVYTVFSQGARQPAIEIILFMFLTYFVWKLKHSERRKLFKLIRKMIVIAPLAAIIFTKTAELVGRRAVERHILTYISAYFCGGLYSFNLHVNEPARNAIWGQSSFADIYQFLSKFGIVPVSYVASYHSFDLYGNTVTMFGRWYEDFGSSGVYIMTILVSLFFSVLFYKYIYPSNKNQSLHLSKIMYVKMVIALVWAGYDDRIRALFSMSNFLGIVLIFLIYKYFVERHVHIKIR